MDSPNSKINEGYPYTLGMDLSRRISISHLIKVIYLQCTKGFVTFSKITMISIFMNLWEYTESNKPYPISTEVLEMPN